MGENTVSSTEIIADTRENTIKPFSFFKDSSGDFSSKRLTSFILIITGMLLGVVMTVYGASHEIASEGTFSTVFIGLLSTGITMQGFTLPETGVFTKKK